MAGARESHVPSGHADVVAGVVNGGETDFYCFSGSRGKCAKFNCHFSLEIV